MLRRRTIKSPNSRWTSAEQHEQQARQLEKLAYAHRQSASRKRKKKKRRSNILFLLLGVTLTLSLSRFFSGENHSSNLNPEVKLQSVAENYTLLQVKYVKEPENNPDSIVIEFKESGFSQYLVKSEGPQNWLLTEITQNQQSSIRGTSFTFPLSDEVLKAQAPRYALYKTGELILLNIPATQDTQGILVAVRRKVQVIAEK